MWNPATDTNIAANYDIANPAGKLQCKAAVQKMFGLPERDVPVFGIVSRLHWQKGIDLLEAALPAIMQHDLQMIVLGTGDPEIEGRLAVAANCHNSKLGVYTGFDTVRSHAIQAGSDFFMMPSRYEPCGLGQLYAMAYGTIPVVRSTGGLADTIVPYQPLLQSDETATGISFVPMTWQALARCVVTAVELYENKTLLNQLRENGMKQRYSWERSCEEYVALYRETIGGN